MRGARIGRIELDQPEDAIGKSTRAAIQSGGIFGYAGMIDGLTRFGALIRIVLPLSAPGIAAVALFTFTGAWNELLFALVLTTSESVRTAPLALNYLITSDVLPWGPLMAGAVISSVPLMILYFVAQRFMVAGMAEGAVKG